MSESTAKPYLIRALYEWCSDQGYTPYLVVSVSDKTKVPVAYVRDGQITLNISATATQQLTMDNEWVLFNARFNGTSQEVAVPMDAVIGLYARETGYGMGFTIPQEQVSDSVKQLDIDGVIAASEPKPTADGESPSSPTIEPPAESPKGKSRAHLSIVK